jgi:hypothetical protein
MDLVSGHDRYAIEVPDRAFDGRIGAIRLTENGRFGNVFYQLLHAVLLARHLSCLTVELFPFEGGPPEGSREIAGLTFVCSRIHNTSRPTLVGHFFNSYVFQSALTGFDPNMVVEIVDTVLRPLFCHLPAHNPQDGAAMVMNFRGGDIFRGDPVPEWYLQPPASYYTKAALFARERLGVERITIVAEDRCNPALAVTEAALHQNGFAVTFQSSSLETDIGVMLSARSLVSPFSTLCEALAMLSTSLQTYFAFRQFESHRHLHIRRPALLTRVLKAHGVRPVRIIDRMRDYIPPLSWRRTDAQIRMMRDFPVECLDVQDLTENPDETDDCFVHVVPPPITTPAAEAYQLRQTIITLRAEITDLRAEITDLGAEITDLRHVAAASREEAVGLRNSMSWRVTAPARWAAQKFRQLRRCSVRC